MTGEQCTQTPFDRYRASLAVVLVLLIYILSALRKKFLKIRILQFKKKDRRHITPIAKAP